MNSIFMMINVGICLFYLINFMLGYKRGFLLQVLDLIGLLVIIYLAWLFAPVLATYFEIWPKDLVPLQTTIFQDSIYSYVNQLTWFIVIFIVLKIVVWMIRPLLKAIQSIPIFKQLNGIAGSIFSFVYSTVWMILLAFILTLPIIPKGSQFVLNTWLQPILTTTSQFIEEIGDPLSKNAMLDKLVGDMNSLSENDRVELKKWFEENHLDEVLN